VVSYLSLCGDEFEEDVHLLGGLDLVVLNVNEVSSTRRVVEEFGYLEMAQKADGGIFYWFHNGLSARVCVNCPCAQAELLQH